LCREFDSRYLLTHPYNKVLISIRTFSFSMHHYFIIYKPYLVLSQFTTDSNKHRTLKDVFDVPPDMYAIGRLDNDSEGLLILTNDKELNHRLLHPSFKHEREYWVQVDGAITTSAIKQLEKGVVITVDGKPYQTKPCKVKLMDDGVNVIERDPPIRFRKEIPTSWISIILTEGKNRQVKKMTAKVGFPTLRLIRYRIKGIELMGMKPGDLSELSKAEIYKKLFHDKAS
jgi:23S rRNA pseudouridine2457 synthase